VALTTRGASVRVLVAQGRRVLIDPELDARELPRLRSVEELSRRVQSELDEFQAEHLVVDALPDGVLVRCGIARGSWSARYCYGCIAPCRASAVTIASSTSNPSSNGSRVPSPVDHWLRLIPMRNRGVDVLLVASDVELTRFFGKLGRRLRSSRISVAVAGGGGRVWGEEPVAARPLDLGRLRPRAAGRACWLQPDLRGGWPRA
jgi:hypothetical protein